MKTWDTYAHTHTFASQYGSELRHILWWIFTRWSLGFENLLKAIFDTTKENYKRQGNLVTHLNRPLGIQEVAASRISKQSGKEDGKIVSPMHGPPLPLIRRPWYSFLLEATSTPEPSCGWESNPRPSGL